MAKVSTKRRKDDDNNISDSIFDHFDMKMDDNTEPREKNKPADVDVSALLGQIKALSERVDKAERTNMALMSQPVGGTESFQPNQEQKQQKPLPDPTLDPDAYAEAVRARIMGETQQLIDNSRQQYNTNQQGERDISDLWTDFGKQYADYAENEDRVEFAAGVAARKAKARGLDIRKYMFQGREQFFSDVVKIMDDTFGKSGNDDDAGDTGEDDFDYEQNNRNQTTRKRKATNTDDDNDGRTAGVFGGLESGGRPVNTNREQKGDMIKDLQEIQRKSGFF